MSISRFLFHPARKSYIHTFKVMVHGIVFRKKLGLTRLGSLCDSQGSMCSGGKLFFSFSHLQVFSKRLLMMLAGKLAILPPLPKSQTTSYVAHCKTTQFSKGAVFPLIKTFGTSSIGSNYVIQHVKKKRPEKSTVDSGNSKLGFVTNFVY